MILSFFLLLFSSFFWAMHDTTSHSALWVDVDACCFSYYVLSPSTFRISCPFFFLFWFLFIYTFFSILTCERQPFFSFPFFLFSAYSVFYFFFYIAYHLFTMVSTTTIRQYLPSSSLGPRTQCQTSPGAKLDNIKSNLSHSTNHYCFNPVLFSQVRAISLHMQQWDMHPAYPSSNLNKLRPRE